VGKTSALLPWQLRTGQYLHGRVVELSVLEDQFSPVERQIKAVRHTLLHMVTLQFNPIGLVTKRTCLYYISTITNTTLPDAGEIWDIHGFGKWYSLGSTQLQSLNAARMSLIMHEAFLNCSILFSKLLYREGVGGTVHPCTPLWEFSRILGKRKVEGG
jgi:hypothetical protein